MLWDQFLIIQKEEIEYKDSIDNTKSEQVRSARNNLLKASDWTQIPDCTVDKTIWAKYRQELRDVTTQDGFPHEVVWLKNLFISDNDK